MSRPVAALAVAGVAWVARGVVALADPAYSEPVAAIDYAAVGLYSLALASTAAALVLLARLGAVQVHRVARAALLAGTIGGIVAGLANFGEDWLGLSALSWVYVAGVLAFYLGMIAAGLVLVTRSRELRWVGALLLIPFLALLLGQAVGHLIGGGSLLGCAALLARPGSTDRA